MPLSTCDPANDTGTASTEYLVCQSDSAPFSIRIHRDAIDGIARDILEQNQPQPAITPEVGGLLLGRVISGDGSASVWIDRFQRIACRHNDGPGWALNDEERGTLESSANVILDSGEHSIIGFYRSHTRPDTPLQVDHADLDLIRRYFADPTDLVLLIHPINGLDLEARFFTRTGSSQTPDGDRRIEPAGSPFAFQGRGINLTTAAQPDPVSPAESILRPEADVRPDSDPDPEVTRQTPIPMLPRPAAAQVIIPGEPLLGDTGTGGLSYTESGGHRWWPLLAAMAVVALIGAFFLLPPGRLSLHRSAPSASATASATAPASAGAARPLGLSVNPDGATWLVSWNSNATALDGARSVQLFVREGDDQNRIDLSQRDLASGTYQYHPTSDDVTFRLEVTAPSGTIAAESYRFRQTPAPASPPPAETASQTAPQTRPAPAVDHAPPRPIQRVAPVVGAGIRQRIPGIIPLDIRVTVDRKGRVMTAEPVARSTDSLHKYLSSSAVAAARQWRFEPARVGGQATDGEETIHFVFQK